MKARRQFAIINAISNKRIGTQEELLEELKQAGFNVTQATISRDIKELQLIKIADNYGYRYAPPETQVQTNRNERMHRRFKDSVVNIDYSENIIVVKTLPGAAQSIALLIDSSEIKNIMGTVAGDDTIFIAVKPKQTVKEVANYFNNLTID
ncbi:Arginine pathway regulatory protein ArgR, repressor of arg regulon [Candidatus Syntrophocurvum alkaliphilum]|uniref:Arginine repressor n=1 Tax=Candidatus Syntrophocurvum alkaliphilum TaxID=2293317 RepID=A0A6I6D750_9FIRM|nr:arginine repressor [Candidatus Syntrophocurvum alkaliphilum]QGT98973.1 Arginine pathway regulatory protein ArgR, repressor of arg regulon [Candidatus Syntrophocurvum alkaliphilum]